MVTAFYRRQEFFRCSYFVYNNFREGSVAKDPSRVDLILRSILSEKPRMKIHEIAWEAPVFFAEQGGTPKKPGKKQAGGEMSASKSKKLLKNKISKK